MDEIKMNVCNSSQRQHPVLWAMAGLCAGVQLEEVTLLHCSLAPVVTPKWPRGQEVREPVCTCTYVGGLFLRQLQLLLGIFESLRVFVQFIFGALEFLLQRHQLIFQLGVGRGGRGGGGVQQAA